MYFIRHNKLQEPFNDYNKLSLDALDALAQHQVDPEIVPVTLEDMTPELLRAIEGSQIIYCSPSLRARQTAEHLDALAGGGREIRVDERLVELSFVPSLLVQNPDEHPLTAVRERLYSAMRAGEGSVSDFDEVMERVKSFFLEHGAESACAVAHGFLIRLLLAAEGAGQREEIFERVESIAPVGYLQVEEVGHLYPYSRAKRPFVT